MPRLRYIMAENPQPRWVDPDHTVLDINVTFPDLAVQSGVQTCRARDPGWEHTEEIFARAIAGEFGPIAPYVAPSAPPALDPTAQLLDTVRELQERLPALEAGR
jgi:hypothetical protein